MAEDKKNLSPDAENEPVKAPDETISELSDALEKKLHENENENVSPEKVPEPTDDDVLAEIKEALDKAEKNEDENDILSGKAADDRFERISEEDFKLQLGHTSDAFAVDMLLAKFIQGIPVVGVIGGLTNPVYYR